MTMSAIRAIPVNTCSGLARSRQHGKRAHKRRGRSPAGIAQVDARGANSAMMYKGASSQQLRRLTPVWAALLFLANGAAANLIRHPASFCAAIDCSTDGASCTGGFHYGNESLAACTALCQESRCSCLDWRDNSLKHKSPWQPGCRLTNESTAVKASSYGYEAFVDGSKPPPPPPPPPSPMNPAINYACRPGHDSFAFCNVSMPLEDRLS